MTELLISTCCILLHYLVAIGLAVRQNQQTLQRNNASRSSIPVRLIQCFGVFLASYTLLLPAIIWQDQPLKQCILRVIAFFYGCKILDLALTKSRTPPRLFGSVPISTETFSWRQTAEYAFRLLTEMRYHSFDIAAEQKQRPTGNNDQVRYPLLAMCLVAGLDYFMPLAELKCIGLLLFLQVGFETTHSLLHPKCGHALFFRPFSAASAGAFWTTHWHAAAAPFLQSLGYRPGKRLGGKWLGVLATFNITGIWHGWASAALVEDDYSFKLGGEVWALFMLQGVLCIVERLVWGDKQAGMVQRVLVWTISVAAAGQCARSFQRHCRIPALAGSSYWTPDRS